jgi:hypothetical protein
MRAARGLQLRMADLETEMAATPLEVRLAALQQLMGVGALAASGTLNGQPVFKLQSEEEAAKLRELTAEDHVRGRRPRCGDDETDDEPPGPAHDREGAPSTPTKQARSSGPKTTAAPSSCEEDAAMVRWAGFSLRLRGAPPRPCRRRCTS